MMRVTKHVKEFFTERLPEDFAGQGAAHTAVTNALAKGTLVRQPCETCGKHKTDAHHPDYSKPLEVVWLCRSCHKKEHGRRKREEPRGHYVLTSIQETNTAKPEQPGPIDNPSSLLHLNQ